MNYEEVDEETQSLFDEILGTTSIVKWLQFRVFHSSKLKELYKVQKMNDLVETLSDGVNIVVTINGEIFDQLTDLQKRLAFEEALTCVAVDPDSDKVSITQYDFQTHTGFLQKHGDQTVITLKESIKSLFEQKLEKEKLAKQQKAEKKKKKSY